MKNRRNEISIGTVADRTGLPISTIRFYEAQGLVRPERNAGGQRRFLKSDIRRLSFVMIAQKFGFTLDQIKDVLESLPDERPPNAADWARISRQFHTELTRQIDMLTKFRDTLDGCIGCGCLSLQRCALYNPDDRAASLGQGPRYIQGDSAADIQAGEGY